MRLKRLRMRAWRRGMKEMDLILGGFVDAEGQTLADDDLTTLERLMNRQDQLLFAWISGASEPPDDVTEAEAVIVARISEKFTEIRV